MTFTQISAMLGRRLEDEDSSKFPKQNRIDAVNNAMHRLANVLDNDMLEELRTTDTLTPAEIGTSDIYSAALSGLSPVVQRNGIQKVYDTQHSQWVHLVDPIDLEKTGNLYLTPSANYAIAYVYGANIYLMNGSTGITAITVWYVGKPTTYVIDSNESSECPFNAGLHPLVVDLAEAELWKQDGKNAKAQAVLEVAEQEIQTLNQRAASERKEVVGRTQQNRSK